MTNMTASSTTATSSSTNSTIRHDQMQSTVKENMTTDKGRKTEKKSHNQLNKHENNQNKQPDTTVASEKSYSKVTKLQMTNNRQKKTADYLEIAYEDLEIFERCGKGSFGSVYRSLWKSRNKIVAVKRLLQLEDEAEILGSCSHRNIIQFYGIVSKEPNFCIITG